MYVRTNGTRSEVIEPAAKVLPRSSRGMLAASTRARRRLVFVVGHRYLRASC